MAAKAGATYVSPFVGRLDDINLVGMELSAIRAEPVFAGESAVFRVYLKNPETGAVYLNADGEPIVQKTTGVQFRENLTVGLTYKFGHKDGL